MEQGQDTKISEGDNFEYEEEQSLISIILKNGLKILLGLIVVVAIIIGIIFSVRLFTGSKSTTTTKTANSSVTPTTKPGTTTFPNSTATQPRTNAFSYRDNSYNYSVQLPIGWEAFKRTEINGAYQIGIRPVGSTDVPMVINTQPNPQNMDTQSVIYSAFGQNYPYQNKTLGGQNFALITDPTGTIQSYFLGSSKGIYELSINNQNPDYYPTISSVLDSFKITQ